MMVSKFARFAQRRVRRRRQRGKVCRRCSHHHGRRRSCARPPLWWIVLRSYGYRRRGDFWVVSIAQKGRRFVHRRRIGVLPRQIFRKRLLSPFELEHPGTGEGYVASFVPVKGMSLLSCRPRRPWWRCAPASRARALASRSIYRRWMLRSATATTTSTAINPKTLHVYTNKSPQTPYLNT